MQAYILRALVRTSMRLSAYECGSLLLQNITYLVLMGFSSVRNKKIGYNYACVLFARTCAHFRASQCVRMLFFAITYLVLWILVQLGPKKPLLESKKQKNHILRALWRTSVRLSAYECDFFSITYLLIVLSYSSITIRGIQAFKCFGKTVKTP